MPCLTISMTACSARTCSTRTTRVRALRSIRGAPTPVGLGIKLHCCRQTDLDFAEHRKAAIGVVNLNVRDHQGPDVNSHS